MSTRKLIARNAHAIFFYIIILQCFLDGEIDKLYNMMLENK